MSWRRFIVPENKVGELLGQNWRRELWFLVLHGILTTGWGAVFAGLRLPHWRCPPVNTTV